MIAIDQGGGKRRADNGITFRSDLDYSLAGLVGCEFDGQASAKVRLCVGWIVVWIEGRLRKPS